MNCHAYVDFDGTIMLCDTTDYLFERFALPEWRAVEEEWASGHIGSRECMARQVALLRVTKADLEAAAAELEIDPGFANFLSMLRQRGIGVTIVSDGLDRIIDLTLKRFGLEVPFYANRLVQVGDDTWRLEFPHARDDCAAGSGHCKCSRTAAHRPALGVVVGDGRSDFCIAGRADLVLAKSKLIRECEANGLPHLPFREFSEAEVLLADWLNSLPANDGRVEEVYEAPSPRVGPRVLEPSGD
jgi:2-hydroxy-3-keto-5-methylthiopentenyl-1-phosphate phosphatase